MGLGKTIQTISFLAALVERKGNFGPHLILAPKVCHVIPNSRERLQQAKQVRWHTLLPSWVCIWKAGSCSISPTNTVVLKLAIQLQSSQQLALQHATAIQYCQMLHSPGLLKRN